MGRFGWIFFSGICWFLGGVFLLQKGVFLVQNPWFLGFGVILGFVKGRFVFVKTVQKMVKRIEGLSLPIPFFKVYPPVYFILILVMMGFGFLLRFVPGEMRGLIDVAVGSALIQGAFLYFRAAFGRLSKA